MREWRKRADLTVDAFADAVGVRPRTVLRWQAGAMKPSRASMQRIYEVTGGAVRPNDFYDLPPLGTIGDDGAH